MGGKLVENDNRRGVAGEARQSGRNTLQTDTAGSKETLSIGTDVYSPTYSGDVTIAGTWARDLK